MVKKKNIVLAESGVDYDPVPHTYSYKGKELKGITGTLINLAYPKSKTYKDIPEEILNHAAERGSACHQAVGNYYDVGISSTGYEGIVDKAVELLKSKELTPIRFEYVVTDYKNYASPIDIVCVNAKDEICIVDMKFTAKLHYPEVTLQTSIYKRWFSVVNPKLKAKHQYVLWIHTNDDHEVLDNGIFELDTVDDAFIDDLIDCDTNDKKFDIAKYYGDLPAKVADVEGYIVTLEKLIKEKTEEMDNIKAGLCELMNKYNIKQYSSAHIQLTRVTPKPRISFDQKRFKEEHADLFEQYTKTTEVKPSIRLTIK